MGGTEFIGLHLVQSLLRENHEVVAFNRGRRPELLPAGARTIVGDRKDHASLKSLLASERFDGVFDVTYAPTLADDVAALLDALSGRPHVVFVSTGRVYDHNLPIPYSEDTPRGFYWGDYARHKIGGEDVLFERHRRDGLPVSIVRPTHVMGPLNTRNNETFLMDRIRMGRPVLIPGHGGWLRQFGHVEDLADAMVAMLGNPRTYGQAYNVMGDDLTTQTGFVELIAEIMGRPVTVRHFDAAVMKAFEKPGPVYGQNLIYECHAVHTTQKLRQDLGISPRYTLASGLRQTWEWYGAAGLDRRSVDTSFEDQILSKIGA